MNEYIFSADLLNKFSQLTPWVQAVVGVGFFSVIIAVAYFFKEIVRIIALPFKRGDKTKKQAEYEI